MIELVTNGQAFTGWTDITLSASIETFARSFAFSFHGGDPGEPLDIVEGTEAKVRRDGRDILQGYVDTVTEAETADSHDLTAEGRSPAGDLVDCDAIRDGGSWRETTIRNIAQDLVRPFGLAVTSDGVDLTPRVRKFALQESDTVHEALERIARAYGFLWASSAQGDLVATTAGRRRNDTEIRRGENVLGSRRESSMVDRFSKYSVVAQLAGDDSAYGSSVAHVRAEARDDQVPRYRPKTIVAETQLDRAGVESRAKWERAVRYGRSQRMSYDVRGWGVAGGGVWEPNVLHHVFDPRHGLDEDLLICGVSLRLTESDGEVATLELVRPEAFAVDAVPPRKKKREKGRTDLGGFG